MVRTFLASLVVVACAAMSAQAITLDGDIADWDPAWLRQDAQGDNVQNPNGIDIKRTGVHVEGNMLYAVMELYDHAGTLERLYPGIFINTDRSTSTQLSGVRTWEPGTDLCIETNCGFKTEPKVPTGGDGHLNYWGAGGAEGTAIDGGVPGGDWRMSGNVVEWCAPINGPGGIRQTIAGLSSPYNVDTSSTTWYITIGAQGRTPGQSPVAEGYDYDFLLGDTDYGNTVDITDLGNLLANYGSLQGKTWASGDTDGNGNVDITDLGNLLANYGRTHGVTVPAVGANADVVTSTVPEPTSIAMLASLAALLGAWVIRRAR